MVQREKKAKCFFFFFFVKERILKCGANHLILAEKGWLDISKCHLSGSCVWNGSVKLLLHLVFIWLMDEILHQRTHTGSHASHIHRAFCVERNVPVQAGSWWNQINLPDHHAFLSLQVLGIHPTSLFFCGCGYYLSCHGSEQFFKGHVEIPLPWEKKILPLQTVQAQVAFLKKKESRVNWETELSSSLIIHCRVEILTEIVKTLGKLWSDGYTINRKVSLSLTHCRRESF